MLEKVQCPLMGSGEPRGLRSELLVRGRREWGEMIARSLVLAGQLNMGPVILFHLLTKKLELKVFLGFDVVVKVN